MIVIKTGACEFEERLLDGAASDDLIREIHVRRTIEAGVADSEEGRTTSVQEVRKDSSL